MTTIAYKDGILAADSCITLERNGFPLRRYSQCKINVYPLLDGGRYKLAIATQGADGPCILFEQKMRVLFEQLIVEKRDDLFYSDRFLYPIFGGETREDAEDPEDNPDGVAIIVDMEAGASRAFSAEIDYVASIEGPYALGSDAAVAWGALHAGANAVDAVKAACIHGAYTSFPIHFTGRQYNLVTQVYNGYLD